MTYSAPRIEDLGSINELTFGRYPGGPGPGNNNPKACFNGKGKGYGLSCPS